MSRWHIQQQQQRDNDTIMVLEPDMNYDEKTKTLHRNDSGRTIVTHRYGMKGKEMCMFLLLLCLFMYHTTIGIHALPLSSVTSSSSSSASLSSSSSSSSSSPSPLVDPVPKPLNRNSIGIGSPCSTSGTRGFPPVPCSSGPNDSTELECVIFDEGAPEVDLPNRGTCQPVQRDTSSSAASAPPRLLLTEIGSPLNVRLSGSFIEIFNPNEEPVDLAEHGFAIGKISPHASSDSTPFLRSSTQDKNRSSSAIEILDYNGNTITTKALKGTIEPMSTFIVCTNKRSYNRVHGVAGAEYKSSTSSRSRSSNSTSVTAIEEEDGKTNKDPLLSSKQRKRCDYRVGAIADVMGNDIVVLTAETIVPSPPPKEKNISDTSDDSDGTLDILRTTTSISTPDSLTSIIDIFGGNVYMKPARPHALPMPFVDTPPLSSMQTYWAPLLYGRAERVSYKKTHATGNSSDTTRSTTNTSETFSLDSDVLFRFDASEWHICSLIDTRFGVIQIDNNPDPVAQILREMLNIDDVDDTRNSLSCPERAMVAPDDYDPGTWRFMLANNNIN